MAATLFMSDDLHHLVEIPMAEAFLAVIMPTV